jgi:hypothetical protein
LDGTISHLCYTAFHLILYHVCSQTFILATHVIGDGDLISLEYDNTPDGDTGEHNDKLTQEGQILNPLGGVRVVLALASESSSAAHFSELQAATCLSYLSYHVVHMSCLNHMIPFLCSTILALLTATCIAHSCPSALLPPTLIPQDQSHTTSKPSHCDCCTPNLSAK